MDFPPRSERSNAWYAENQQSDFNDRNRSSRTHQLAYHQNNRNSRATIDFCKFFSHTGKCNKGNQCRFRHNIVRIEESDRAYDRPYDRVKKIKVSCCEAASKSDGSIDIFIAWTNKELTKWVIKSDDQTGKPRIIFDGKLHLDTKITSCLYYQNCLFCGMEDGKILIHFENGQHLILEGHQSSVYSMTFVDDVLISGDWNGYIKMWKFDNQINNFQCVKEIETSCKITCLKELSFFFEESNTNVRYLWIGGTKMLILDLSSLNFVKVLTFSKLLCLNLISFQGNMIAGFTSGEIKVYSHDGSEICQHNGPFLSCIEGMIVKENPLILHATDKGYIHFIKLPGLEDMGALTSNKTDITIKRIINLGQDHFLTFRDDGHITIWRWLN